MKKLISYFIKYPIGVDVILLGILIFGYLSYSSLNTTFFPVVKSRIISIQVIFPGASPEEIEEGIIAKIEENLKGTTGVERYTSVSSENAGSVTVEVLKGYDPDLVIEDVKNAVNRVPSFPGGMEPIVIYKRENLTSAINFAISGENVDLKTLKTIAREVERELTAVPGISKVDLAGFPDEEIEIAVSEEALRAFDITFAEAANILRGSNIDVTGGSLKGETEEILIRAHQKKYSAEELVNLEVKALPDGRIIRLKDIGTVRDRWSDNPNRTEMNNKPSVEVNVQNTDQEDLLSTAEYVRNYIESFNRKHDNVRADVIRDFSITLNQRKELLINNGVLGIILVLALLAMFLNIRLAFWVAVGIPVSFAGMFILANLMGITINVISLFGMIVVIGILVDDGIVISENIYHRYEKGESLLMASLNGTLEVMPAVISSVTTTIVAFSSFYFLDGRAGDFFSELAFIVMTTLAISLFEGILFLPAHLAHSKLKRIEHKNAIERGTDKLMNFMRNGLYAPTLTFFLTYRAIALALFVGLLIVTIGAFRGGVIRGQFFPFIERDNLDISLAMPAGTREQLTQKWLDHIEQAALAVNEDYKANRADGKDVIVAIEKVLGPTTYQGTLNVILLDSESRNAPSFEIQEAIRQKTGEIYEADNLSYGSAQAFGKPISVSLLSRNAEQLSAARAELKNALLGFASLRDVVDTDREGVREVDITLKDKARLLGLTVQDVMQQVRSAFFGFEAQRIQRGRDEVKVWVRLSEEDRRSMFNLEELMIRSPQGGSYPLREVASYTIQRGVININHLDGQREVKVEADLRNPNESAPAILEEIRANVMPEILAKYPSVVPLYEGQNREAMKTQQSAKTVLLVIVFLIILIITFTFRSLLQTITIMLMIPLSFAGVAWGHYFHGMPLSILSFLGMVALIGIIVNDSLVLVTKFNSFIKDGMSFNDAIYHAGVSRFRAIFLTTVTTVAGLAPLIFEKSFQAQFLKPMAVSIAYGILYATFLTLVMLPVVLSFVNDLLVGRVWLWTGIKPAKEDVEPAKKELKDEKEMDAASSTER